MKKLLLAVTLLITLTACVEKPIESDKITYVSSQHPNEEVYIIPIEYFFIKDFLTSMQYGQKFDTDITNLTLLFETKDLLLTFEENDIFVSVYQKGDFVYLIIKDREWDR
jgi:hypothetical protein